MKFNIQSKCVKLNPSDYERAIAGNLTRKQAFLSREYVNTKVAISNSESTIAKYHTKIKKYNGFLRPYPCYKRLLQQTKKARYTRSYQILKIKTLNAKIIKAKNYISHAKATNIRLQAMYSRHNAYLNNKDLQKELQQYCDSHQYLEEYKQIVSQVKRSEIAEVQVLNHELQNIKEQYNHITQHLATSK